MGLVRGDNLGSGPFGQSGLLNDPSSLSIKTKLGMGDGIRSTKAFMTSITPNKNMGDDLQNLNFGVASQDSPSPKESSKKLGIGAKRQVFGEKAFLARQQKLAEARQSEPP